MADKVPTAEELQQMSNQELHERGLLGTDEVAKDESKAEEKPE